MADKKRKNWIVLGSIAFIVYIFAASTPIENETVLRPAWLKAPKETAAAFSGADALVPFSTDRVFGYFNAEGEFPLVRVRGERTAISSDLWADYDKNPTSVTVNGSDGKLRYPITERGSPFLADGKVYVVGIEQNSIVALDEGGKEKWRRDFPSVITCADAAAGLIVFGMLDGTIELIDSGGARVFAFEPGGSRLPVIAAAKLSPDGKKIVLVSGIDPQRFVLLERSGQTYKVAHHEYLDRGFRRPVRVAFIGGAKYVAFERENGLAVHDIAGGKTHIVDIKGQVVSLEDEGKDKRLFLIADAGNHREMVGIRLPAEVFMRAPFLSSDAFLARRNDRLYLGGNGGIAALDIKTK